MTAIDNVREKTDQEIIDLVGSWQASPYTRVIAERLSAANERIAELEHELRRLQAVVGDLDYDLIEQLLYERSKK